MTKGRKTKTTDLPDPVVKSTSPGEEEVDNEELHKEETAFSEGEEEAKFESGDSDSSNDDSDDDSKEKELQSLRINMKISDESMESLQSSLPLQQILERGRKAMLQVQIDKLQFENQTWWSADRCW